MTFISYAQNYEDVMLWRALKHVQRGFYIDVGAAWPDTHSVTKAFYLNGWTGLNIEPNPSFQQLLKMQRPKDINLEVAAGDVEGKVLMKFINGTGLSTISEAVAKDHKQTGWEVHEQEVQLVTLSSICNEYLEMGQEIHFLKIDVEGLEEAVLRGNDWSLFRPWIVLVEATLPMSQTESYGNWESILVTANYSFIYADGLNRFYVADEHRGLCESFKYPPNVFDGFVLSAYKEAEAKAQEAEAKAQEAEAKAQEAEAKAQEAEAKAQEVNGLLNEIYMSRLWKMTEPFRQIMNAIKR